MTVLQSRVGHGGTEATIERYTFAERLLHWWVALTFIALMVSGFALGYPRLAFLSGLFGGGQTMRFLHPWIGVGFTAGVVAMFFAWAKDMRFDAVDRMWRRRIRTYSQTGHTGLDIGRYNAGQKGYF
ncbi:MAG: cytochrome b/b6 domain-containing protein, partial [Actinomycetota bacterium]